MGHGCLALTKPGEGHLIRLSPELVETSTLRVEWAEKGKGKRMKLAKRFSVQNEGRKCTMVSQGATAGGRRGGGDERCHVGKVKEGKVRIRKRTKSIQ